jgi:hypothetical protein
MFLDAVGGIAVGVQLQEILDRYTQLEWDDEWAAGVAEHGDRMHKSLMARVVVDMGTRKRLFTGSLRDAVMLSGARCVWPGCDRPVTHCQADHSTPHERAGPTATRNGGPLCAHHNRWKTRGFYTTRQPDGQWTILRVNGSRIGWQAHLEQLLQDLQPGA